MESAIFIYTLLFLSILFLLTKTKSSKKLPPGSLGIPIIGQSLQLLRAMRSNKGEEWLQKRIQKYGPISKLNVFGTKTVFVHGPAANKFIYTCDEKILANRQPGSIRRLIGARNILELSGEDHKRVRGALVSFLRPEALKQSVGRIDEEIRLHLEKHWHGKDQITVMQVTKTLTFNVISSLIFGIERGARRETFIKLFAELMVGMLVVPINLPFTRFNKGIQARVKIRDIILQLIDEKRENHDNVDQDLITSLLNMHDETNSRLLSDEEIVDNCIVVMLAGYDTTSTLLSFLIKLLAENLDVYQNVLNEQEEIAKGKEVGECLRWDDLAKMKYTWRVATETLRMNTPVFCQFRRVLQDIEIGGYIIPKGWQVFWTGFMTHMDDSIFLDPLKFNPSRFEKQGGIPAYSFIAFGGGPRMCPGYEFARIETLTLMHYLVTRFIWKLSIEDNSVSRDPMPVFNQGLPINIELKKPMF